MTDSRTIEQQFWQCRECGYRNQLWREECCDCGSRAKREAKHKWERAPDGSARCVRCAAERGSVNGNLVYKPRAGEWRYSYVPCG